ncbi:hypothetical protein [Methanoregula sp.]|uniref:hypothetical protein n=1 Tax=Methanoregula sp. TaxID=2052170 RepID=UPI003C72D35B
MGSRSGPASWAASNEPVTNLFFVIQLHATAGIPGFTRSVINGRAVKAADSTGSGNATPAV